MSPSDVKEILNQKLAALRQALNEQIFGQQDLIDEALCCLLSEGHLLMTGAPGLAKTTLVKAFSSLVGTEFGRVQFTPDLMPSDIVGAEILNMDTSTGKRAFHFSEGPVFVNLLLADEINRASPRTQSALLEAMQERAVTVAGKRYPLPRPFMVFATENPFESEGTFPLPEAQLDRFLIHSLVDYPNSASEIKMLERHNNNSLFGEKSSVSDDQTVMSAELLSQAIEQVKKIAVPIELLEVVQRLVAATRPSQPECPEEIKPLLWYGAGPRAGIALVSTMKAWALIQGRDQVRWQDLKRLAKPVMRHRLRLSARAKHQKWNEDRIIDHIVASFETRYSNLKAG